MGDVTLTVWDQEVRGGQAAQIEQLNKEFQAKYPNITIKRVSRSFDDLKTTLRLALSGQRAARRRPGQQRPVRHGRVRQGRPARAPRPRMPRRTAGTSATPSRCASTRRTPRTARPSAPAASTACRRSARSSASTTTTPSSRRPACEPPKTWAEFEAALATAEGQGRGPARARQPRQVAGHPRVRHRAGPQHSSPTRSAPSAFGRKGGSWTTPENTKAAQTLVDWVDKGYFSQGLQRPGLRPGLAGVHQGHGRLPHRRHLAAGRPRQGHGRQRRRSCCRPAGGRRKPGRDRRHRPAVRDHRARASTRTPPRPTSTSSPARTPWRCWPRTATCPSPTRPSRRRPARSARTVFKAFGTAVEEDGLVPYLDYATPTMADTLGAALQDLLAKKATPEEFLDTRREGLQRVRVRRTGDDGATQERRDRPGEPRRIAYLYLLPAFLVYAAFLLYPLVRSVQISLYDWDGNTLGDVGRAGQLRRGRHRPGAAVLVRPRAGAGVLLRGAARWSSAWCSRRSSTGPGCAGWRSSARWSSCRRSSPWSSSPSRGGGSTPPTAASTTCCGAVGLDSLTRGWLGDYTLRAAGGGLHRHVVRDRAGHGAAPGRDGPDLRRALRGRPAGRRRARCASSSR